MADPTWTPLPPAATRALTAALEEAEAAQREAVAALLVDLEAIQDRLRQRMTVVTLGGDPGPEVSTDG